MNPYRVQFYLSRKARYIRRLVIKPVREYHNLCDFLNIFTAFIHRFDAENYPFPILEEFSFTFFVLVAIDDEHQHRGPLVNVNFQHPNAFIRGNKRYYGTGGVILQTLRRFISSMRHLKTFRLNNLLLEDDTDIGACLYELLETSAETLRSIEVLNYTSHITPMYIVGLFPNLQTVSISFHSLNDDVLLLFANHLPYLSLLKLVQDELTILCRYSSAVWSEIQTILSDRNQQWNVEILVKGKCDFEPMWLERPAPVRKIVYDTQMSRINQSSIYTCLENYRNSLETFVR